MFASKDSLLTRPSGYNIARSVRLRSSASGYFNRTPSVAGNQQKFTYSAWVKLGSFTTSGTIFSVNGSAILPYFDIRFGYLSGDFKINVDLGPDATRSQNYTTPVYRDFSAWYHVVIAIDTTQATASNRLLIYINGISQAYGSTSTITQNLNTNVNTTTSHAIGRRVFGSDLYFDGYLTEINFIDGQALTPSSFGETDSITGVWKPKAYSGTYGTNGFELNFSDNSNNTAATIGKDYSGNGNNWTPNNISVTAGATYDSMQDVPTLTSATAANYCVMNPLMKYGSNLTWANGNLQVNKTSSSTQDHTYGTVGVSSGKWYWEMTVTSISGPGNTYIYYGIGRGLDLTAAYDNTAIWYTSDGTKTNRASASYNQAYGATYTAGDVIAVALDLDAGTITFYKNNTSQGVAYSNLSTYPGLYMAHIGFDGTSVTSTTEYNFGQRPFSYTPPTGFVALNTYNLPASTITNGAAYMAATLYTGTGSSLAVSNAVNGVSFQPDLVWIKARGNTYSHNIEDSVRGVTLRLQSDSTAAEAVGANGQVTAFSSGGFTQNGGVETGGSSATYVGWQWKAGTTSASNTNGSITSTVSAGATQGFSVVTYTGTGSSATVGHGLGVAPNMIICKARGQAENWAVYHSSLSNAVNVAMFLNLTNAVSGASNAYWNSTAPSSTVFSVNTATTTNAANTMVAYCFSAVAGYSAFGSYTGNGSADGPFVYLGFRPRWVMFKNTTTGAGWLIFDSSRNTYNLTDLLLQANQANAEAGNPTDNPLDFLSNGFKLRYSNSATNASAEVYIYAAFAEVPFKSALGR